MYAKAGSTIIHFNVASSYAVAEACFESWPIDCSRLYTKYLCFVIFFDLYLTKTILDTSGVQYQEFWVKYRPTQLPDVLIV